MGDTHSWFGLLRRLAVPELGDGKPTQPLVALIDDAKGHVEEADLPLARFGLLDGDCLANPPPCGPARGEGADRACRPLQLKVSLLKKRGRSSHHTAFA